MVIENTAGTYRCNRRLSLLFLCRMQPGMFYYRKSMVKHNLRLVNRIGVCKLENKIKTKNKGGINDKEHGKY